LLQMINKFAALLLIGMASPYQILDWYGGRHTCHTASGALANSSLQDRSRWSYIAYRGAEAILDAILNYTFLPHIWNVYPGFFSISYGSHTAIKSQNSGTYDCTQDPLVPRTTTADYADTMGSRLRS